MKKQAILFSGALILIIIIALVIYLFTDQVNQLKQINRRPSTITKQV